MRAICKVLFLALILGLCGISIYLAVRERYASHLTADDLAEALSIHWWTVKLPNDLKPNDEVGVESISSDGKVMEGGGGFSSRGGAPIGSSIRVYCWEEKATHQAYVRMKTTNGTSAGMHLTDYFKDAAVSGSANGTVLNVGDILLKFDSSKSPSMTGGNELMKGQTGLRVTITKGK